MGRIKRPNKDLQEISGHLYYECWMFLELAEKLAAGKADRTPMGNAALEAFIIHARNTFDFLYKENPHINDVSAVDFIANPEDWRNARPPASEFLKACRKRMNKEVAHLTYDRLNMTEDSKQWEFTRIAEEIHNRAWLKFLEMVPEGRLDPRMRQVKTGQNAS